MKNLKELLKQITVLNELAEIRAEEVLTAYGCERDYYYEGCGIFTTEELIGIIFENKDDSECIELSIEHLEMDEVEWEAILLQIKIEREEAEKQKFADDLEMQNNEAENLKRLLKTKEYK